MLSFVASSVTRHVLHMSRATAAAGSSSRATGYRSRLKALICLSEAGCQVRSTMVAIVQKTKRLLYTFRNFISWTAPLSRKIPYREAQ